MTKLNELSQACEIELAEMFQSKVILTIDINQKDKMSIYDLKYY